jgi:hypothetical protein
LAEARSIADHNEAVNYTNCRKHRPTVVMAGLDPATPAKPVRNRRAAHSPAGGGRGKPCHDGGGRIRLSVAWYSISVVWMHSTAGLRIQVWGNHDEALADLNAAIALKPVDPKATIK